MASISSERASDGSPRYVVNYRDPGNRQRRKSFRRKAEAERFRNLVEADKARGTYLDVDAGRVTFAVFAAEWLAARTFNLATYEATELRLRIHVLPVIGEMELRHIKPSSIQALLRSMELSDTYKRVILANVSAVLAAAVDDELITKNPCKARSVTRPSTNRRKVVPWLAERISATHDALPHRYRLAVTLGSGLGLRQGEIFGLSLEDIDFLRGTVKVDRQVKILAGNKLVFAPPEGGKTRSVPLPSSVAAAINAHLANLRAQPVELPWETPDSAESVRAPLLLTTRERRALNRNYFNGYVWRAAQTRAGVEPTRENGMHALRHWYASVLLDAGESIRLRVPGPQRPRVHAAHLHAPDAEQCRAHQGGRRRRDHPTPRRRRSHPRNRVTGPVPPEVAGETRSRVTRWVHDLVMHAHLRRSEGV